MSAKRRQFGCMDQPKIRICFALFAKRPTKKVILDACWLANTLSISSLYSQCFIWVKKESRYKNSQSIKKMALLIRRAIHYAIQFVIVL